MKRLSILLVVVAFLLSCETFGFGPGIKYTFNVIDTYNDNVLKIDVPSLEVVSRMTTGRQVVGVHVQITNTSSKHLTIKWSDSSIRYDGKSHVVFLSGFYFSDAGRSMPDSNLGPDSQVSYVVYPADNIPPAQQNEGDIAPIYAKEISCSIVVDVGGESRTYVVQVTTERQNQQPSAPPPTPAL